MLSRLIPKMRFHRLPRFKGFTLTELLTALIVSSLVLTLLLSFTVSLTRSNQEEDAKASTQDEITAALNYIANDLQEAVFIYDDTGLNNDSTNPTTPGIKDQIYRPSSLSANQMRPVLVFWKRNFYPADKTTEIGRSSDPWRKAVRCLGYNQKTDSDENDCFGQSRFVYSLVSYSLVRDNNSTWSPSARIVRHEIQDGIRWSCAKPPDCPPKLDKNGNSWTTTSGADYEIPPDPGFRLFDISGSGTLENKMNKWTKDGNYNGHKNQAIVLIDNVDDIPGTRTVFGQPQKMADFLQLPNCKDPNIGLDPLANASLVPTINLNLGESAGVNALSSFYACVANFGNPSKSLARVWLRGSFASRLTPNRNQRQAGNPLDGTTTSDITVLSRGVFKTDE